DGARFCQGCGKSLLLAALASCPAPASLSSTGQMPAPQVTGDATGGIIPYKNVAALIGYYCAVFSLVPCLGFPLGLSAVVLGLVGLRKQRSQPVVRGRVHA